jgi:glycosyltransferase involved in cell wall biosynthesis
VQAAPLPKRGDPLVSIVTPCLNADRFLEECLTSVAAQEYPAIEHIVVDGGSTDGTHDILRAHPGVHWSAGPDSGQSAALNVGFARARGDIVGWLNADDFYLPHAVSAAVAALETDLAAAAVYANHLVVDADGHEVERWRAVEFELESALRYGNPIPGPTVFIRRSALDVVGPLEDSYHYAMDFDLWLRLAACGTLLHVDDWWAAFRIHPGSKTGSALKAMWREERLVSRNHGGPRLSPMWWRHQCDTHRALRTADGLRRRLKQRGAS